MKSKRRRLPPQNSDLVRKRIRLTPGVKSMIRKSIQSLIDASLTDEERAFSTKRRNRLYTDRIHDAITKASLNVLGEKLPPEGQREQLVELDLDSEILVVSEQIWDELVKELAVTPERLKTIDRRTFEQLIAFLFEGFGYEVELTQQTRDGGRDIIAVKKVELSTKYLIECKRPDPGNVVGVRPVRELYGVKSDEGASKAVLATTTHFSKDAKVFMERHRWELELRDYDGIIDWITQYLQIN